MMNKWKYVMTSIFLKKNKYVVGFAFYQMLHWLAPLSVARCNA